MDEHAPGGAELLDTLGGVRGLLGAGLPELVHVGLTRAQAARVIAAAELARRAMRSPEPSPVIRSPADVHALVAPNLAGLDHERLLVVCLDTRNRAIAVRLSPTKGYERGPEGRRSYTRLACCTPPLSRDFRRIRLEA